MSKAVEFFCHNKDCAVVSINYYAKWLWGSEVLSCYECKTILVKE